MSQRYTHRNSSIQHELAARCLELQQHGATKFQLLLDLGCGSGLSSSVIEESGHTWIGVDVAREMLLLAAAAPPPARGLAGMCAGLIQSDLSSLPLRAGAHIDGAISVSTLQWLCEGRAAGGASSTASALILPHSHPDSTAGGGGGCGGIDGIDNGSRGRCGGGALQRLFTKLYCLLRADATAVFQFYPTPQQALEALEVCGVLVSCGVQLWVGFC